MITQEAVMGERGPVGKRPDMRHGHGAQNDPFDQVAPEPVTRRARGTYAAAWSNGVSP